MADDKKKQEAPAQAAKDDADATLADLEAQQKEILAKKARDARAAQIAKQKAEREALRAKDNEKVMVRITHGRYVDNQTYTDHDPENPPAMVGDYIEVTSRVAKRLVADKCAEVIG